MFTTGLVRRASVLHCAACCTALQACCTQLQARCAPLQAWCNVPVLERVSLRVRTVVHAVTSLIFEKNGAGMHTASSCFWDSATDGAIDRSTDALID